MKHLILAIALVPLGGGFGEASASARPAGIGMEVELRVEVVASATAVIAHIVVGGDEAHAPVSLDHRSGGVFTGLVTLPIQDSVVVFERLDPSGSELSGPATLTDLGVDFSQFSVTVQPLGEQAVVERIGPDARRWMWLAIGAGAAALSALAFWAMSGREEAGGEYDEDGQTSDPDSGESDSDSDSGESVVSGPASVD